MEPGPYLDRILDDESLAGDLDEPDAAALVKALTGRAEADTRAATTEEAADAAVQQLRTLGRAVGKVVVAWRDDGPAAAADLARQTGLPTPPAAAKTTAAVLTFLLDRLPPAAAH